MADTLISITFLHKDGAVQRIDAPINHSLMEVARDCGVKGVDGVCGGVMACATCHCYIHPDWQDRLNGGANEKTDEEADMLDVVVDERPSSRLSCQIILTEQHDGLVVALPEADCGF